MTSNDELRFKALAQRYANRLVFDPDWRLETMRELATSQEMPEDDDARVAVILRVVEHLVATINDLMSDHPRSAEFVMDAFVLSEFDELPETDEPNLDGDADTP